MPAALERPSTSENLKAQANRRPNMSRSALPLLASPFRQRAANPRGRRQERRPRASPQRPQGHLRRLRQTMALREEGVVRVSDLARLRAQITEHGESMAQQSRNIADLQSRTSRSRFSASSSRLSHRSARPLGPGRQRAGVMCLGVCTSGALRLSATRPIEEADLQNQGKLDQMLACRRSLKFYMRGPATSSSTNDDRVGMTMEAGGPPGVRFSAFRNGWFLTRRPGRSRLPATGRSTLALCPLLESAPQRTTALPELASRLWPCRPVLIGRGTCKGPGVRDTAWSSTRAGLRHGRPKSP